MGTLTTKERATYARVMRMYLNPTRASTVLSLSYDDSRAYVALACAGLLRNRMPRQTGWALVEATDAGVAWLAQLGI